MDEILPKESFGERFLRKIFGRNRTVEEIKPMFTKRLWFRKVYRPMAERETERENSQPLIHSGYTFQPGQPFRLQNQSSQQNYHQTHIYGNTCEFPDTWNEMEWDRVHNSTRITPFAQNSTFKTSPTQENVD